MNYIITLNVGDKYNHAHTINLWHAVRRALPDVAYRFICYTEKPKALPNYIEARPVPRGYVNGWWSKLMLFDCPEIQDGDSVTFLDLDLLIGPQFKEVIEPGTKGFRILNDFAYLSKPYRFGSAVMTWRQSERLREIPDEFLEHEEESVLHFAGDQEFIQAYFKERSLPYAYFDARKAISWKWGGDPPEDWQVIAFHGEPSPKQAFASSQNNSKGRLLREHWAPALTIESYRDAYAGKCGELLLTGPSLASYRQDSSMVSFGVNSILHEEGWQLDHYLIQDRGHPGNPRSYSGDAGTVMEFTPHVAKWFGDFGFQDEREARANCAGIVRTHTGPIQEENGFLSVPLPKSFTDEPPFETSNSVAFTALQMMVYMGLSEIYVVGADLDGGRIGESGPSGHLDGARRLIMGGWELAKQFCRKHGVRLIMVNPRGLADHGFIELHTERGRETPVIPTGVHTEPFNTTPGENMRFHLLTPPYAATSEKYSLCAYTQKVLKWARMMEDYGYEVHHYGHPDHELPAYVQHHDTIFDGDWEKAFGDRGDWREVFFDAQNEEIERIYNERTREILRQTAKPKDFILHFWSGTRGAALGLEDVQVVEPGIGYSSTFATFRVFESYAILNNCHGNREAAEKADLDPWQMDTVIPNYFDPKDFIDQNGEGGYFLYLGRVIPRKGMEIIVRLARDTEIPVVVAGQGKLENAIPSSLEIPDNVECVGYADVEQRKQLMGAAKACLVPTLYNEPFGGVAVEAMLSGTPVITSDNGAFPETVVQGVSGYRCRNYAQYVRAVEDAPRLSRAAVRKHAERYLMENVAPMYHEYFQWVHHLAHDTENRWWTVPQK